MNLSIQLKGNEELRKKIKQFGGRMTDEIVVATNAGCLPIMNKAKELCQKKTRTTASSIHFENIRVTKGYCKNGIGPDADQNHARGLEYGTKPHIIVPKTKKALFWEGAAYPVKKVMHPGTRPYPFMRPAYDMKNREAVSEIKIVFLRLMDRFVA